MSSFSICLEFYVSSLRVQRLNTLFRISLVSSFPPPPPFSIVIYLILSLVHQFLFVFVFHFSSPPILIDFLLLFQFMEYSHGSKVRIVHRIVKEVLSSLSFYPIPICLLINPRFILQKFWHKQPYIYFTYIKYNHISYFPFFLTHKRIVHICTLLLPLLYILEIARHLFTGSSSFRGLHCLAVSQLIQSVSMYVACKRLLIFSSYR